jgi:hypothetical protein
MKKILVISFVLMLGALFFSLSRFGLTVDGFMKGDGNAILEAGAALIVIWALVITFSITAIGATVQLSKLPTLLKLRILRHRIPKKICPFLILALVAGAIPFFAILNTDTKTGVYESSVTVWLIVGFILQLLLILSSAFAAYRIYEDMSLIPAIKEALKKLDDNTIKKLKKLHADHFKDDFNQGKGIYLQPMSVFIRSLTGDGSENHEELVALVTTLLREKDPQVLDMGIQAFSDWAKMTSLQDFDSYLEYRLVPICFYMIRIDQELSIPLIFRTRLYYLARLISNFLESGATLTGLNAANPMWEMIEEFSQSVGMSNALDQADMAIYTILYVERKKSIADSILLNNLLTSIPALAAEKSSKGIGWIFKLLETYRLHLESVNFTLWPEKRSLLPTTLGRYKYIYIEIDKVYGENAALFAGNDIRYWILVNIRRMQETFVDKITPESLTPDQKEKAVTDFDYFNQIINGLLTLRIPQGDTKSYEMIKYNFNPYINTVD